MVTNCQWYLKVTSLNWGGYDEPLISVNEGYQNYVPQPLKETTNWSSCRPDINENSKISLLPGYLNEIF